MRGMDAGCMVGKLRKHFLSTAQPCELRSTNTEKCSVAGLGSARFEATQARKVLPWGQEATQARKRRKPVRCWFGGKKVLPWGQDGLWN